jgi:secondary thiamine-phosphate synthase enzyme
MIPKSGDRFSEEIMRQAKVLGITEITPQLMATATLRLDTPGASFTDITSHVAGFIAQIGAGEGALLMFLRHTSASLTIQENADPDVQTDLACALDRLAPQDAPWIHDVEGPDDMPAHVKAMLTGVSLHVPVTGAKLALGTWQGIYLVEHRRAPHSREIVLQFVGSRSK